MWYTSKTNDLELIFLYDQLMIEKIQKKYDIKLTFVSFAYIEGYKLFTYRKQHVAMKLDNTSRTWGNTKVFGALYAMQNPMNNLLKCDAINWCSTARIDKETPHDMKTRTQDTVYLFELSSVKELTHHQYKVNQSLTAHLYVGNKCDDRLIRHMNYGRYRIKDGIDCSSYKLLLQGRGIECL